jgi:hypothetical protein
MEEKISTARCIDTIFNTFWPPKEILRVLTPTSVSPVVWGT